MSKPFKDLTIKDVFMFAAVMVEPDKCGPFLEMEAQYMMLEEMLKDEREAGRKEGHEAGRNEGLKIGRLEGEEQSMKLVNVLISQERYEDLKRCLEDRTFREELLEQFGIKGNEG